MNPERLPPDFGPHGDLPVTRGPAVPSLVSPPQRDGPLVTGPLGPLVTGPLGPLVTSADERRPGRIDLEPVAAAREREWGADASGSFPCPIPGHEGLARVDVPPAESDPHGDLRLLCCSGRWRSLGEVRAARAYGCDLLLSNIELATWTRRLAYEHGAFEPLSVLVPALPQRRSHVAERAREGFRLLLGLRRADGPTRPVAFSVRFCAAWCGLTFRQANLGLAELKDTGVIQQAGRVGRTPLYLPGRTSR